MIPARQGGLPGLQHKRAPLLAQRTDSALPTRSRTACRGSSRAHMLQPANFVINSQSTCGWADQANMADARSCQLSWLVVCKGSCSATSTVSARDGDL
jgi:hypothetical protein